jgi:predicted GNAT family N-acyltransferase
MQNTPDPPEQSADYEVGLAETVEERAAIFALRMVVFVEEQAVPPDEELDSYDLFATHFLVRLTDSSLSEEEGIIGTARLVDRGGGVGKVGRVAVRRDHRGRGIGARLMRFIEETARAGGFCRLVLDAQRSAIPFYAKLGYLAEGDVFLDAGIEHRCMGKDLLPSPSP